MKTNLFHHWLTDLRGRKARAKIETRIRRLRLGNPGDVKPVGEVIPEMRIDYGPGYRGHFTRCGPAAVGLLYGSDKGS
ncbi:type II toxin-antitoxin system RelE/ParE family toxin [Pusillimonas sp. T2]|uniref:type II toxin-antitoxin system RelE/ParE family toxin n=1 Tax=Pusillimonas sp. T2 TaxID=1548123 RepID=UPI002112A0BF|nr:type II toxin-antitoxin system RelE/ParE family toxin [Pusillimonas sp. T2]